MKVKDRAAAPRSKVELEKLEIESEYIDTSGMPDTTLLRFGMSAKSRCLQCRFSESAKLPRLMAQFEKARKEWNRRRPNLPLTDSF